VHNTSVITDYELLETKASILLTKTLRLLCIMRGVVVIFDDPSLCSPRWCPTV